MKRKMNLRYMFLGTLTIIILVFAAHFVLAFHDPVINYYGVRLRESQLVNLFMTQTPAVENFGMYCYARPLHDLHEQSICFNTQAEIDDFLERKYEIERQLAQGQ